MNHLEDKDIREALRRKEARRPQTEEPTDFFEHVMEDIDKTAPQTEVEPIHHIPANRMKSVAIILSVAASMALVLLFAWPRFTSIDPKQAKNDKVPDSTKMESGHHMNEIAEVKYLPEAASPQKTEPSPLKEQAVIRKEEASPRKQQVRPIIASALPDDTDSLQYYIDKIERELAQVDESLYIDRMNKVIRADERLQRIVNSYILHSLDEDGRPQSAENLYNVKPQENEK